MTSWASTTRNCRFRARLAVPPRPGRRTDAAFAHTRVRARRAPHDRQRGRLGRRRQHERRLARPRLESRGIRIVLAAAVPDEIDGDRRVRQPRARPRRLPDRAPAAWAGRPTTSRARRSRRRSASTRRRSRSSPPSCARASRATPTTRPRWAMLPGGQPPAAEPARRRARLRDRATSGRCPGCRPRWRRCSTRTPTSSRGGGPIAAWRRMFATREGEIVEPARGGDRPLAAGHRRLVPALRPAGRRGRGRAQVDRRRRARRGRRLARAGDRARRRARTLARPPRGGERQPAR